MLNLYIKNIQKYIDYTKVSSCNNVLKVQHENIESESGPLKEGNLPSSTNILDTARPSSESKMVPVIQEDAEEDAKEDLKAKEDCNSTVDPQDGAENDKLAETNIPDNCTPQASKPELKNSKSFEDSVLTNGTKFIGDTTSDQDTTEDINKVVEEVPQGSTTKETIDNVQDKDLDDEGGGILRKVVDGLPCPTIESDGLPSNANESEEIDLEKPTGADLTNECSQVEEGNNNIDDTAHLIGNT